MATVLESAHREQMELLAQAQINYKTADLRRDVAIRNLAGADIEVKKMSEAYETELKAAWAIATKIAVRLNANGAK